MCGILVDVDGQRIESVRGDEIESAGPRSVRALITVAGNPALSAPNGARLDRALGDLDHMVAGDPYLNETTRHAHVVLPPAPPLARARLPAEADGGTNGDLAQIGRRQLSGNAAFNGVPVTLRRARSECSSPA